MKYYSEEETKDLRLSFEEQIQSWPQVSKKIMFGCPSYKTNEKLFVFLITKGIVITKLNENQREELSKKYETGFFQAGKKIMKNWIIIPIKQKSELGKLMPFVIKSYNNAILESKQT
ncbi:MAG: hypothetical protein AC479_02155 [miscellaneous Crenarchaeota group-6 archaeon AD8-1]|nr:MAG: hypothetical protein AC479_02155 [miscellaneous Crenarchaeota group-6 archaeon AD8-1]